MNLICKCHTSNDHTMVDTMLVLIDQAQAKLLLDTSTKVRKFLKDLAGDDGFYGHVHLTSGISFLMLESAPQELEEALDAVDTEKIYRLPDSYKIDSLVRSGTSGHGVAFHGDGEIYLSCYDKHTNDYFESRAISEKELSRFIKTGKGFRLLKVE